MLRMQPCCIRKRLRLGLDRLEVLHFPLQLPTALLPRHVLLLHTQQSGIFLSQRGELGLRLGGFLLGSLSHSRMFLELDDLSVGCFQALTPLPCLCGCRSEKLLQCLAFRALLLELERGLVLLAELGLESGYLGLFLE